MYRQNKRRLWSQESFLEPRFVYELFIITYLLVYQGVENVVVYNKIIIKKGFFRIL